MIQVLCFEIRDNRLDNEEQLTHAYKPDQSAQPVNWLKACLRLLQELISPFRPALEQNGRDFPKGNGIS